MNKVDLFLRKYNMSPEGIDITACTSAFLQEMEKGLKGEDSSLMMLPSYLTNQGELPKNRPAAVIDAGGTNLRVALVTFTDSGHRVEMLGTYPMPGSGGELTRQEFLTMLAGYVAPAAEKADTVGFCFSFPAEILPDRDAKVLTFSKEVKISDCQGMLLCDELEKELQRQGVLGNRSYCVLNDTAAALLGGIQNEDGTDCDGVIGFILGTGTNTAYVEKAAEITKIGGGDGYMIVNTEAAGFNRFPLGEFERRYDAASAIPGDHLYEKLVSGVYHCCVIYQTALQAAKDGLFSLETAGKISAAPCFTGPEVDEFIRKPLGSGRLAELCVNDDDRETLYTIIDRSFERGARLITANLVGVMLKSGCGKSPLRPARISAEGSTFNKSKLLRGKVDYYVKQFINETLGLWCEFVSSDETNLLGTAAAALLNT